MKTDVVRATANKNNGHAERDAGVVFVIVEPVAGKRRSPIDEYLMYYNGAGVHHIGLKAADIVTTVEALRKTGSDLRALRANTMTHSLLAWGRSMFDGGSLRENEILVDRDEWGYLLQIFAKPAQTRPTFSLRSFNDTTHAASAMEISKPV
jgi:4-hydroxyphenylpyruvate dioxygenase